MAATIPEVRLPIDSELIADFCRRHRIRKLALFGSVLRDDFGPDSDVDVLYAFEPDQTPGLAIADVEEELSHLLGRPVDFVPGESLSPRFAARVLPTARVIFNSGDNHGA